MAQWNRQFSGLTHATKVQDIEASLRLAVAAFDAASDAQRASKAKTVRHLAERLLTARSKALRARLSALQEPGAKCTTSNQLTQLQAHEGEFHAQGVEGILQEFHFDDSTSPNNLPLPQTFPGGLLRRLRPSDLTAFQAYRAIPELGRFQGWSPLSDAEALAFLSQMNEAPLFTPGEWIQLGIAEPETDRLIGDIGLFLSEDGSAGKVGFTLEPAAQGRGIATAAVRTALRLFFHATSAQQMEGLTDTRNTPSIRLLERLGFRHHDTRTAVYKEEACTEKVYLLPRDDS